MTKITLRNGMSFDEKDVVGIEDWEEGNPNFEQPFLIHTHGSTICIVFARCEGDAIDIAVDENKLDAFQITEEQLKEDYGDDEDNISFCGNASEMFDLDTIGVVKLLNPKLSFTACYREMMEENK